MIVNGVELKKVNKLKYSMRVPYVDKNLGSWFVKCYECGCDFVVPSLNKEEENIYVLCPQCDHFTELVDYQESLVFFPYRPPKRSEINKNYVSDVWRNFNNCDASLEFDELGIKWIGKCSGCGKELIMRGKNEFYYEHNSKFDRWLKQYAIGLKGPWRQYCSNEECKTFYTQFFAGEKWEEDWKTRNDKQLKNKKEDSLTTSSVHTESIKDLFELGRGKFVSISNSLEAKPGTVVAIKNAEEAKKIFGYNPCGESTKPENDLDKIKSSDIKKVEIIKDPLRVVPLAVKEYVDNMISTNLYLKDKVICSQHLTKEVEDYLTDLILEKISERRKVIDEVSKVEMEEKLKRHVTAEQLAKEINTVFKYIDGSFCNLDQQLSITIDGIKSAIENAHNSLPDEIICSGHLSAEVEQYICDMVINKINKTKQNEIVLKESQNLVEFNKKGEMSVKASGKLLVWFVITVFLVYFVIRYYMF